MPERLLILRHSRLQTALALLFLAGGVASLAMQFMAIRRHDAAIKRMDEAIARSDAHNRLMHERSLNDRGEMRRAIEEGREDRRRLNERVARLEGRAVGPGSGGK